MGGGGDGGGGLEGVCVGVDFKDGVVFGDEGLGELELGLGVCVVVVD